MVHEITCGLSFQLKKGGIDDGIEDGCETEGFENKKTTNIPYGRERMPNGKLQSVDDIL
jgi:hypothetical protein